ncbi:hypothetical protein AB6A40_007915 [Gnathostoma spinigerum]|uniref:PKD/Chitinase domain-containing protein n=1 Tax=Gnathostoma spinigerum TaxID=75299 RepID=A0ABD6EUS7_9BILA
MQPALKLFSALMLLRYSWSDYHTAHREKAKVALEQCNTNCHSLEDCKGIVFLKNSSCFLLKHDKEFCSLWEPDYTLHHPDGVSGLSRVRIKRDQVQMEEIRNTSGVTPFVPKSCSSDTDCSSSEICFVSESVVGICICRPGFERGNNTQCVSGNNVSSATLPTDSEISFEIVGPREIKLPQERVQFTVRFTDAPEDSRYSVYWEVIEGEGLVSADTYTQPILSLKELKPGKLSFRATVTKGSISSSRTISVNILAEQSPNHKPKAVIRPASPIEATEGTQIVLDAEGSVDEDGDSLLYEWKLLSGPAVSLPALNSAILRLQNLDKGTYKFGVTVKDSKGAVDGAEVVVNVSAKRDDPPKAQISECGKSIKGSIYVRLPVSFLYLCGNSSTDDNAIKGYRWLRIDNLTHHLPVDTSGSSTSVLTLQNLQNNEKLGPYIFQLEVEDEKGQKDSTSVSIFVNKAINQAPVVDAGANQTVQLPETTAILDGIVKDDGTIVSYQWTQLSGPNQVNFVNQDKSKCTVSGLEEGIYQFGFNATDDGGLNGFATTFVTVIRSRNEPPTARAKNVSVTLPTSFAVLNASESIDDAGIVRYKWIPHDNVPLFVSFLGNSSDESVAVLTGLVPGEFLFDLIVADQANAEDSTVVHLTVSAGLEHMNSIEIYMDQREEDATYRLRNKLEDRLSASLTSQIPEANEVYIHFTDFSKDPSTGQLRVVFYADYSTSKTEVRDAHTYHSVQIVKVERAVLALKKEANMKSDFRIVTINTLCMFLFIAPSVMPQVINIPDGSRDNVELQSSY